MGSLDVYGTNFQDHKAINCRYQDYSSILLLQNYFDFLLLISVHKLLKKKSKGIKKVGDILENEEKRKISKARIERKG